MYTLTIITIIVSLSLIVFACYYLNNKVVDHRESISKPQNTFVEQAANNETADAPEVVDAPDATIKKVIKRKKDVVEPVKKTSVKKSTHKSQSNAKLRDKRI